MFIITSLFKKKNKSKAYSEQVAEFLNRKPLIKKIPGNTISLSDNMGYTTAILGVAGGGRTNTAAVLLQELVAKKIPFTTIDLAYQWSRSLHLNSLDLPDYNGIDVELGNMGQITSFKESTNNEVQRFAPLKAHSIVVDKTGSNLPQIRGVVAAELAHYSVFSNVPILINQGRERYSFDDNESETTPFVLQYLRSLLNSLVERKNSGSDGEDNQQQPLPPYFLIIDELPKGMIDIIEKMATIARTVNLHICYIHFTPFWTNGEVAQQLLPHTDTFFFHRQEHWLCRASVLSEANQKLLETLISRAENANIDFLEIVRQLRQGHAIFFPPHEQQPQPLYLQFEVSRWLERLTAEEEKRWSLREISDDVADNNNN